jgi:hypothetical protein
MAETAPVIAPVDYHYTVETLKELLAFWLMVSRETLDPGMGHSFVQDAIAVMMTAEENMGMEESLQRPVSLIVEVPLFSAQRRSCSIPLQSV